MTTRFARFQDGLPLVADDVARDAIFPAPPLDQRVYNSSARTVERYTNLGWVIDIQPGGASTSLDGLVPTAHRVVTDLKPYLSNNGATRFNVFDYVLPGVDIGDGTIDALPYLTAAAIDANAIGGADVLLPMPSVAYSLSGPLVALANVRFVSDNPATTLRAAAGFTANYLVEQRHKSILENLTLDGTNMPAPTQDWLGVGSPKGIAIWADGTTNPVDKPVVRNVTLSHFPNGGIFFRGVTTPRFLDLEFTDMQSTTSFVRSGVIEMYQCLEGRGARCTINGYTMKAFNLGACTRTEFDASHAYGPGQNAGHAAFYEDGSTDCAYTNCYHEGAGASHKSHQGVRPVLFNFKAIGSSLGPYFQASSDVKWIGGEVRPSFAYGGIIESITALGGPSNSCLIHGVTVRKSTPGASTNDTGFRIAAIDSGQPLTNVTIRDCTVENMLFGVWIVNTAGVTHDNIVIDNLTTIGNVQYSILGYVTSARIRNCRLSGSGGTPAISIATPSGVTGKVLEIHNNYITGATGTAIEVGGGGRVNFDMVSIQGNISIGCQLLMAVSWNANAADRIAYLSIQNNTGLQVTGGGTGATITFNTTTTTLLRLTGNALRTGTNTLATFAFTNSGSCIGGVCDHNDVGPFANLPTTVTGGAGATAGVGLNGTAAYSAGAIAAGVEVYQIINIPGAAVGDYVNVSLLTAPSNALDLSGYVNGGNSVVCIFRNGGTLSVTPAGTVSVRVTAH